MISLVGDSFMCIETSSGSNGNRKFVSSERIDIFQITNLTFFYSRFSILSDYSITSMGRFRVQLFLTDNTWSTRYKIPTKYRYSSTPTQWTLINLNFNVEFFGMKLIYDRIDAPHSDFSFSNMIVTQSVQ